MCKRIAIIVLSLVLGIGILVPFWLRSYAERPSRRAATAGTVVIPAGTGLKGIRAILVREGVIDDDIRFFLLARLLQVAGRLKAGEYRFPDGATPVMVLRQLEAGRIVRWPVTIPEGATLTEIAEILAKGKWVEKEQFLALVRDPQFARKLGIQASTLEGYLFPDTYYLSRGQGPEEIVRMMVAQLRTVVAELCPGFSPASPNTAPLACTAGSPLPMSLHELLTLASIVEKETGRADERPLVACVFENRLRKDMMLQADPTVIYGIPEFNGDLTREDLQTATPYNTYMVKGLPPTPIASPGRAALQAVLCPASKPYLFFVSRNDGTHQFSTTLEEHNRAVQIYQKSQEEVPSPSRNELEPAAGKVVR
ncbi:MAG: endolytic transglycosylase MltG [Desulfobacteraceae bacterium]|nr:endolytic transglycosylase MltG [Desulfobacteraceae bacterium]